MTALVVLAAVVTVAALVQLIWRAVGTEKRSIHHYEHAMEVLRDLSTRTAPQDDQKPEPSRSHVHTAGSLPIRPKDPSANGDVPTRQPAGGAASAIAAAAMAARRAGGQRPSPHRESPLRARRRPGSEEKLVFVDDVAIDPLPEAAPLPEESTDVALRPPRRPSRPAGRPPTWFRVTSRSTPRLARVGVMVALAVVITGAVVGGVVASSRHSGTTSRTSTPSGATAARSHSSNATHHRSGSAPGGSVTPSTAPFNQVSSDAYGTVIQVGSSGYTVTISYRGNCWTDVKAGQDGSQLWAETLGSGESRDVPSNGGPVWIRVGNAANVSLEVNGMSVPTPPAAGSSPYDFSFVPA